MAANFNARSIFGFNANAQGSAAAVRGWLSAMLRAIAIEIRGIYLCLGQWCAPNSKRTPVAADRPGDVSEYRLHASPPAPSALDVGRRRRPRHSRRLLTGLTADLRPDPSKAN